MDVNPYKSPRETGYEPPRVLSGWWDLVACVVTALVIFSILMAAWLAGAQAYEKSGLDWSRQFRTAVLIFFGTALLAYAALFALFWWRRRKQVRRLTWPEFAMQYRLRTLLIWTTFGPPLLAAAWWLLPQVLPLMAAIYFGAATLYFAAWWTSVRRKAEESAQFKLQRQLDQPSN